MYQDLLINILLEVVIVIVDNAADHGNKIMYK